MKQTARQELDKVRNVKFYAEVTKETEILTGWNPLNSYRVPLNGIITGVPSSRLEKAKN